MSNNETIADIIAEIRERMEQLLNAIHSAPLCYPTDIMVSQHEILYEFADRLEAAWKREKSAIEADALAVGGIVGELHKREMSKNVSKNGADFGQLGDCAKMREALEQLYDQICYGETERNVAVNRQMIRAALAAPVKNCDVGTADEQYGRWLTFCRSYDTDCSGCPCDECDGSTAHCFARWAQMPYEKGGAE